MKEKFRGWGIFAVSILVFLALLFMTRGSEIKFEEIIISKDKWYELMSRRKKTDRRLVSGVKFNEEELFTATDGAEWYYSLIEKQAEAQNPKILYKRTVDGVRLAVLKDKISDEVIAGAEEIKVMAYTEEEYEIYNLHITTLPLMKIRHEGARELSDESKEEKMVLELFDNEVGATQRYMVTDGRIMARGAILMNYPKKNFRLRLKTMSVGENGRPNNTALLSMRQDDDWILYSAYNDQEKIRNVFATNLWTKGQGYNNMFGVKNGSEYKFVELIMNDSYYGLYALGYPVDEVQLALKNGIDGLEEFSFKKTSWDFESSNEFGSFELKTGVRDTDEAWKALKDYMDVINGWDKEKIREVMDVRTAIDFNLFVELTQSSDTLNDDMETDSKNLYLTAKSKDGEYKWLYTPWDLDLTFGNEYGDYGNATQAYLYNADDDWSVEGDVVSRLEELSDEEIEEEVKARYRELREGVWANEEILARVAEYEKEIYESGAFSRDRERWPDGSYNDTSEGLARFSKYVLDRLAALDEKYL